MDKNILIMYFNHYKSHHCFININVYNFRGESYVIIIYLLHVIVDMSSIPTKNIEILYILLINY